MNADTLVTTKNTRSGLNYAVASQNQANPSNPHNNRYGGSKSGYQAENKKSNQINYSNSNCQGRGANNQVGDSKK